MGVVVAQNGHDLSSVAPATSCSPATASPATAALMSEHCPHLGDPFYGGVSTATGDALAWLRAARRELRNMGACLRHGLVVVGRGTRVSRPCPFIGAVLRQPPTASASWTSRPSGYSGLAGVLQDQPGERAVMVWDDDRHGRHPGVRDDAGVRWPPARCARLPT